MINQSVENNEKNNNDINNLEKQLLNRLNITQNKFEEDKENHIPNFNV